MDNLLEKLLNINKIPTKLIFVICLCSAVILFVPPEFLTKLNLTEFVADYGKYIGIAFILTLFLMIIVSISYILKIVSREFQNRRINKKVINELLHLNTHELALLREFFIQDKFAIKIPIHDDTMIGLLNKGIIYQASNIGPVDGRCAISNYSLSDSVRDKLTNVMLGLTQKPIESEKRSIIEARPLWAKVNEKMNSFWKESTWF